MHALDENTIDLWRMDDSSGATFQNLASSRHLTVVNASLPANTPTHNRMTAFPIGNYSYAYCVLGNPVGLITDVTPYSIEFWIYRNGLQPYPTAYIIGSGWPLVYTDSGGNLGYNTHYWNNGNFWATNSYSFGAALPVNEWHHVAFVFGEKYWDSGSGYWRRQIITYLDGVQKGTQNSQQADFYFGSFGANGATNFIGMISDVRFSNKARTQSEILAEVNSVPDLPVLRSASKLSISTSTGLVTLSRRRTNLLRYSQPVVGLFKTTEDVIPVDTFTADSVTADNGTITITFSDPCVVSGHATDPSEWIVADSNGKLLQIKTVTANSNTIILTTDEQTNGAHYSVVFPSTGIQDNKGKRLDGPFSMGFTGVGVAPTIVWSKAVDARHIEICFSEPVLESDAINTANYAINNNLQVLAAEKTTSVTYRLTTSLQSSGTQYTITASNIRDLANNPV